MLTDCRESEELQSSPQGQQTDFFPLNYVLFIWQQHMSTASPQIPLIYYCETETKTLELSTPGNPASCFLQHPPVKQQHWKYPRSWEHGAHTDQSLAILPKRTGVSILIIKNVTVGQVTYSGHWAESEAQFLLQKSKLLLYFHNYIFSILSALVSRISCFNSFHKSLLISAGSPDITEGRGIPGLAQITAPGSAGASQQQELHTQSHRRFVWMQQVTLKCGAHNLIILLK